MRFLTGIEISTRLAAIKAFYERHVAYYLRIIHSLADDIDFQGDFINKILLFKWGE